jgi:two-component system nitrate/nitrite response regulator NarP
MDVAAIGTSRRSMEDGVAAFAPDVVVIDSSDAPVDLTTRSVRLLIEDDPIVIAITAEAVSVEAARLVSAGAAAVLGLDTPLDTFPDTILRAMGGREAMPPERRYALEELMRRYRTQEQRRWLPFEELTERERDIFALVYDGLSAEQIAEDACVSLSTVRSHIRNILNKLNVHSQLAAVALARTNEWFGPRSTQQAG